MLIYAEVDKNRGRILKVLIVGAGFAGAVYARVGAEAGHDIHVIDRNAFVGGSAHDRVIDGLHVHDCGPHLFHTSNMRVVSWLSRFTKWRPYTHRSKSLLPDGTLIPFPLNQDSLDILKDCGYDVAAACDAVTATRCTDARQWLRSLISDQLIDILFERYVQKMWAQPLSQLPARLIRRVDIRNDRDDRYFAYSNFQALPDDGYAALFSRMLDHEAISLSLGYEFRHTMREEYDYILNSMPIDQFYDQLFGALPYRSVRFHVERHETDCSAGCSTVNFTDRSRYTRQSHWANITGNSGPPFISTVEEPCEPNENGGRRYYPRRTVGGAEDRLLKRYNELAAQDAGRLRFIGRCGTFRYLNMDQVVSQSLQGAQRLFCTVEPRRVQPVSVPLLWRQA